MHDIFYFTDIHGHYKLYRAIMDYCYEQDPEATIIFGGDAIDRGGEGYKIMKELLDNPYVIYLKGNHEDMFCKAARNIKEMFNLKDADTEKIHKVLNSCKLFDYKYAAIQDSLYNGGLPTLTDWILDGMPMDLIEKVEELPLTFIYNNMDFCHAGGIYKTFKRVYDKEYNNEKVSDDDTMFLIWNRSALDEDWAPNRICVFGHTPVPYVIQDLHLYWDDSTQIQPIKLPIGMGEKIVMDTGAVFTRRAFVLNCLTMQVQGFEYENDEMKKNELIQL